MKISNRIQDLIILAKLILPYEDFKNTLLDSDSKQMTEGLGEKALETAGFIYISKSNTLYQKNKEFIFDFSGSYSPSSDYARDSFYYFNNPDGSMRWIFPVNLKYPTFLGFYNITSWKSKGIAFLIQCAFRLGLQKFIVSGTFDLYSKSEPCFKKYLTNQFSGNYSMFMGTVGPNRKVVFEMNKFGKTTHFAKAALTEAGSALLQNEFYKLDKADDLNLEHTSTPYSFLLNDNRLLIQSSVFTPGCVRSKNWTPVHSSAKLEMEEVTISKTVLAADFLLKIKTRVDKIIHTPNLDPLFSSLSIKVKKLCGQVNANTELLPTSFCHNDFTPWNMYLAPGYLKVYDWELAGYAPVLTDLFHFHIQNGVMMEKKTYADIKIGILDVLDQSEWKAFIKKHGINIHFQFSMYLLNTVTYYLNIYQQQASLHWQAIALIKFWGEALEESITRSNPQTFRQQFIPSFFNELNNKSYACLKFIYGTVDQLPESSDLDILISISDLPSAVEFIKNSRLVSKVKLVEKSFMSTAHIFFKDGSFLEIDLITAFKRKQHSMMNAADVLKGSRKQNGIFIPDIKHDFEYTFLFHQLNSSSIPKRYQDHFNSLPEKTQELITDYINLKYFLGELNFEDLFIKSIKIRKDLDLEISNLTGNLRLNWLKNKINYLKDTLIDILHNRGFTLTVSGVDGAGKSTVIEEIKLLLENKYRREVVVLRHRPSILPILSAYVHGKEKAEKLTTERLPRTGANQSQLKSLFRFSYYLTDYLAGQFYVLFKYILRGKVVVYDRYYFDFISDAKRSNIIINPSIPRALYSLIQKPELNVFLYAPAAEILKRKQELNKTEIESLTLSYKNLFEELSLTGTRVKYLAIENLHLKETMQEIELKIINVA